MDYPCAKFGDYSFSRFGFVVRTDRLTKSHTDAANRYTYKTTVVVNNASKVFKLAVGNDLGISYK